MDHSTQNKDGVHETSAAQRLSEARPKFKPVLVKKLLADESEDEESDEPVPSCSDGSEEEFDDFDGFQPLLDEASGHTAKDSSDVNVDNARTEEADEGACAVKRPINSNQISNRRVEQIELPRRDDNTVVKKDMDQKLVLDSYLKDSLQISDSKSDHPISGAKRKSDNDISHSKQLIMGSHSQWQTRSNTDLDVRRTSSYKEHGGEAIAKSRSYSPDMKQHSYNVPANHASEIADRYRDFKENHRYSLSSHNKMLGTGNEESKVSSKSTIEQMSNVKSSTSHVISNASSSVMDTPMKHPQGSSRPNPCKSHRSIIQTPQNKMGSEYLKNPSQTPATIFSHWSQQHMAQTPMQNQAASARESIPTPSTSIAQSQSSRHEVQRYYPRDSKSVRRPLTETLCTAPPHGSHGKLQEHSIESQSRSSRESDIRMQDSIVDKKPVYSISSHTTHETKENRHPDVPKNESQIKGPIAECKQSVNLLREQKTIVDYHNNAYHSSMQPPRPRESYQMRESGHQPTPQMRESGHQPTPQMRESSGYQPTPQIRESGHQSTPHMREGGHQSTPQIRESGHQASDHHIQNIQFSISQHSNPYSSRQNKIIVVKDHQYLVLGVLGQGMSCQVVRAQDLATSELRAIKCVDLSKMDKDSAQGCLQEICMLDRLKAPCIVHMYNFEIKQPWVHVVMEIGDTDLNRLLKSMLSEKKKIPLTMVLYYWTEMLTAVKHIHENGVIHSDLKPANFLLVRGRLKLIDFGIASNINSDMTSVMKNCPIGTLNYISPEALMEVNAGNTDSPNGNKKFKISYKSDVWSLGCILYGLIYGVTPFNHIRPQWAKISAITDPKHKINFPIATGSDPVPLILVDVMRKCLQRDPKARPTVADLLEVPYLQSNINSPIVPNIPATILMKIRHALTEEEWQKLTEVLENKQKP